MKSRGNLIKKALGKEKVNGAGAKVCVGCIFLEFWVQQIGESFF